MYELYKPIVDRAIQCAKNNGDFYSILRELPVSLFGQILVQPNVECPELRKFLPKLVDTDIQKLYNGRANLDLLPSSVSFIESICNAYTSTYLKAFPVGGKVLDYGFGWGRLLRMCCWLTNPGDIYGVDPQQKSIDICKSCNVQGTLELCDEVPASLPFENNFFDLIFSFSVFTHLSFPAADAILKTLRRYISDNGMLVITIRPIEFWHYWMSTRNITESDYKHVLEQYRTKGFGFVPLKKGWEAVNGSVHFGTTLISLDFIQRTWPQWQIVNTNLTLSDPYQIHVFLVPSKI